MDREPVGWTADMARATRDPWSQPSPEEGTEAWTRSDTRPVAVTAAGWALIVRAVLRLPLPVFVVYYLVNGIEFVPGRRSSDAPDGAQFVWLAYAAADLENVVLYPLAALAGAGVWLVAYTAATAGYLIAAVALWRGWAIGPRLRRAAMVLLGVDLSWRLLWLILVVPSAVDALSSGENQAQLPRTRPSASGESYPAERLVHAYEWMLIPWAVTLLAVMIAVVVLWRRKNLEKSVGNRGGTAV